MNLIPFTPSDTNYEVGVALAESAGAAKYWFDVYWNSRDQAFYFDLLDTNKKVIRSGIKIVLGVNLGRASTHAFFTKHVLKAVDTTGQGKEAGYDDLGGRVQCLHATVDELVNPGA